MVKKKYSITTKAFRIIAVLASTKHIINPTCMYYLR